jgi:hypothetical protein
LHFLSRFCNAWTTPWAPIFFKLHLFNKCVLNIYVILTILELKFNFLPLSLSPQWDLIWPPCDTASLPLPCFVFFQCTYHVISVYRIISQLLEKSLG